jgi:hypothetical protein
LTPELLGPEKRRPSVQLRNRTSCFLTTKPNQ